MVGHLGWVDLDLSCSTVQLGKYLRAHHPRELPKPRYPTTRVTLYKHQNLNDEPFAQEVLSVLNSKRRDADERQSRMDKIQSKCRREVDRVEALRGVPESKVGKISNMLG